MEKRRKVRQVAEKIQPKQDIASVITGVNNLEDAMGVLESRLDKAEFIKISAVKNSEVLLKLAAALALCKPNEVFVHSGSQSDGQKIREMALLNGEEARLPMAGHTIHRDLREEQGRVTDRTFYISDEGDSLSSLAKIEGRELAYQSIREKMVGIARNKTMIIAFCSRGPVGSLGANPAIVITTSAYVIHSVDILYRVVEPIVFESEVGRCGYFYTNIHGEGLNRASDLPKARVFMDRANLTTYSMFVTYAGNSMLIKKGNHRFSVDRAVYINRGSEVAEHMLITGFRGPGGRVTWFAGAAPSGCGKTTTAMAGDQFVGDDLMQAWIDEYGVIRAVNPECGIFGIVEDVNWQDDPAMMRLLREPGNEVIWSNVLVDADGKPHWTGHGENRPTSGINHEGLWVDSKRKENGDIMPISHPNARATVSAKALLIYSVLSEESAGVPIRVVTYNGRDPDTMPSVWAAKSPAHGVVIGACIVSATTKTEVGASGDLKRSPWANAPFIPGSLGEYMAAQFEFFGNIKLAQPPVLAGINYFLTRQARGGSGKGLLGEKRDVKVWYGWLERFAHGEVDGIETPIGFIPKFEDLRSLFNQLLGKEYSFKLYERQFSLYTENILARIALQAAAWGKETNVPDQFFSILEEWKAGLEKLRDSFGPIVSPSSFA